MAHFRCQFVSCYCDNVHKVSLMSVSRVGSASSSSTLRGVHCISERFD